MTVNEKKQVIDEFISWLYKKVGSGNGIGFTILEKLAHEEVLFLRANGEDNKGT